MTPATATISNAHSGWYSVRVIDTAVAIAATSTTRRAVGRSATRTSAHTSAASPAATGNSYVGSNAFFNTSGFNVASNVSPITTMREKPRRRSVSARNHASAAPDANSTACNVRWSENGDNFAAPPSTRFHNGGWMWRYQTLVNGWR